MTNCAGSFQEAAARGCPMPRHTAHVVDRNKAGGEQSTIRIGSASGRRFAHPTLTCASPVAASPHTLSSAQALLKVRHHALGEGEEGGVAEGHAHQVIEVHLLAQPLDLVDD